MKLTSTQIDFLVKFKSRLTTKEFIIITFNIVSGRPTITIPDIATAKSTDGYVTSEALTKPAIGSDAAPHHDPIPLTPGDVVILTSGKDEYYGYVDKVSEGSTTYTTIRFLSDDTSIAPLRIPDTFTIQQGMIENFNRDSETTSVGRFLLNYVVLASTIGDVIPYVNTKWVQKKLEATIAQLILDERITIQQHEIFIDHVYFLGHFTKLNSPASTPKSLYTDPKILKRKQELIEQHKDNLHDPLVIKDIERELLAMDAEFLKGDEAGTVYEAVGAKTTDIHRKKMFLSVGGVQAFSKDPSEFEFIENSLEEGWTVEDFHARANETRKGIYGRGKETAVAGEQTKFILRIFQDLEIVADDCGTTRGLPTYLRKKDVSGLIGRNVIVGNKTKFLDEELANSLVGTTVKLRSPMYCEQHGGLCYSCTRDTFKKTGVGSVSMNAIDVSSTFLGLSMKGIHGRVLKAQRINVFDHFVDF